MSGLTLPAHFLSASSIKSTCQKVLCVGRNYLDHIEELAHMNRTPVSSSKEKLSPPLLFLKPPSAILPPPHDSQKVIRPRGCDLHHEVELVLRINTTLTNSYSSLYPSLPIHHSDFPNEILYSKIISHYLVGIDFTARNLQAYLQRNAYPWTVSKSFDNFFPLSNALPLSALRPVNNAPPVNSLFLYLAVNGSIRQFAPLSRMMRTIPQLLSHASRVMTLHPGDLLLTGTPSGVSSLSPSDHVYAGLHYDFSHKSATMPAYTLVSELNPLPHSTITDLVIEDPSASEDDNEIFTFKNDEPHY